MNRIASCVAMNCSFWRLVLTAIEWFADHLADPLDALGWKSAVIAGASIGGPVALAFAGRYPQAALGSPSSNQS
jgi:3-oxoadipate enol-lactonase